MLITGKLYNISANALYLRKDFNVECYEIKKFLVLENSIDVMFLKVETIHTTTGEWETMSFLHGKETIFLSKDACDLFLCCFRSFNEKNN